MGESLVGAARNLFQIPGRLPDEEFFEELLNTPSLRVERIVSTGQVSPQDFWYDQEEDEWVALLQGEAELEFDDGRTLKLQKGDWAFLPARARHRVSSHRPRRGVPLTPSTLKRGLPPGVFRP
jgi:cupin 2 domain-containing protein